MEERAGRGRDSPSLTPSPNQVEEVPPPDTVVPEAAEEPSVASAEPEPAEQVRSKGILAFRESFASSANLRPSAQLGSRGQGPIRRR